MPLFRKQKTQPVHGLHLGATPGAVIMVTSTGAEVSVTPDLAEKLGKLLPEYGRIARRLAEFKTESEKQ